MGWYQLAELQRNYTDKWKAQSGRDGGLQEDWNWKDFSHDALHFHTLLAGVSFHLSYWIITIRCVLLSTSISLLSPNNMINVYQEMGFFTAFLRVCRVHSCAIQGNSWTERAVPFSVFLNVRFFWQRPYIHQLLIIYTWILVDQGDNVEPYVHCLDVNYNYQVPMQRQFWVPPFHCVGRQDFTILIPVEPW